MRLIGGPLLAPTTIGGRGAGGGAAVQVPAGLPATGSAVDPTLVAAGLLALGTLALLAGVALSTRRRGVGSFR